MFLSFVLFETQNFGSMFGAQKWFFGESCGLQEALARVGNSQLALDEGVGAGRIIKSQMPGGSMPMFFFPGREYSENSVYKQVVGGDSGKFVELSDLGKAADEQLGFQWEPCKLLLELHAHSFLWAVGLNLWNAEFLLVCEVSQMACI